MNAKPYTIGVLTSGADAPGMNADIPRRSTDCWRIISDQLSAIGKTARGYSARCFVLLNADG